MPKVKTLSSRESCHSENPYRAGDKACCAECDRRFSTKTAVMLHKKIHPDGIDEKKCFLWCPVAGCNYHALQKGNLLSAHANVHTGKRPHACPDCPSEFGDPSSLCRHRRSLHSSRTTKSRVDLDDSTTSKDDPVLLPRKRPVEQPSIAMVLSQQQVSTDWFDSYAGQENHSSRQPQHPSSGTRAIALPGTFYSAWSSCGKMATGPSQFAPVSTTQARSPLGLAAVANTNYPFTSLNTNFASGSGSGNTFAQGNSFSSYWQPQTSLLPNISNYNNNARRAHLGNSTRMQPSQHDLSWSMPSYIQNDSENLPVIEQPFASSSQLRYFDSTPAPRFPDLDDVFPNGADRDSPPPPYYSVAAATTASQKGTSSNNLNL